MVEMTVKNKDIAEFGARLLEYTVGGTELTQTTGLSYNANFPKLLHCDYGLRKIAVTLVFRPRYIEKSGIIARLHTITEQKARFDALLFGDTFEIRLPDDFYYRCILNSIGNEIIDNESLEVTYEFSGIRHLPLATIKGTDVYCSSNIKTDCRITITALEDWGENIDTYLYLFHGIRSFSKAWVSKLYDISFGDVIVIDSLKCTVTKNGQNYFNNTDLTEFPTLYPGKNFCMTDSTTAPINFVTEYYPIFI